MKTDDPGERATRERMVEVMRQFLAGTATRATLTSFTREAWPDQSKQGSPFKRDGVANTVFDSIWNADELLGDDYLLRASDFSDFVRWLTLGDPLSEAETIVWIRRHVEDLAALPNAKDTRFWMDGLGWYMSVELASTTTGTLFIATGGMAFENHRKVSAVHAAGVRDSALIDDLLDTFGVRPDEIIEEEI